MTDGDREALNEAGLDLTATAWWAVSFTPSQAIGLHREGLELLFIELCSPTVASR